MLWPPMYTALDGDSDGAGLLDATQAEHSAIGPLPAATMRQAHRNQWQPAYAKLAPWP